MNNRVAIVGSRDYSDLRRVRRFVATLAQGDFNVTVVSGGARGVDKAAASAARRAGLKVEVWRPDYKKHGNRAPIVRNHKIVERADYVVAFWNGRSRGTKNTIGIAHNLGVPCKIWRDVAK